MSWNVETPLPFLGLPKSKTGASKCLSRPNHLRNLLARHDFHDFICLQAVRARHADADWIPSLTLGINGGGSDRGPRYKAYTSLNSSTCDQRHFGIATYVKDLVASIAAVREVDWDSGGRVVIVKMKGGRALRHVLHALNGSEYLWKDPLGKGVRTPEVQARGLRLISSLEA